ncbi:MAG: cytochrome C [Geobacteraceae bacterium]|nr:cytochrome C [Geobacteraceae bacterium]
MSVLKMAIFVVLLAVVSTPVHAKIRAVGKGDKMTFDPTQIPADLKQAFEIMKVKCIQCHTQERTVIAIQTGIAPVTGQPFDKQATKAYGIKMLRKPKSNMSREEVKKVVDLMNFLIDEAAKP